MDNDGGNVTCSVQSAAASGRMLNTAWTVDHASGEDREVSYTLSEDGPSDK